MPGAPLLIWSNGHAVGRSAFSVSSRSGDVVGGDQVERAVGQAGPQRVAVGRRPERRRDDEPGARGWIGVVVALLGQDEVVRAGLGRDADAGRLGAADLVERRRGREVDDVDRRLAIRANASARAVATAST